MPRLRFTSYFEGILPQFLLQGQCDRLNIHLLNFVRGDRYFTQKQIFSNDLMYFGERSPQQSSSKICRRDRNLTQQQILSNDLMCFKGRSHK